MQPLVNYIYNSIRTLSNIDSIDNGCNAFAQTCSSPCVQKAELTHPNVLPDLVPLLYRLLALAGELNRVLSTVHLKGNSVKVDPAHKKYTSRGNIAVASINLRPSDSRFFHDDFIWQ